MPSPNKSLSVFRSLYFSRACAGDQVVGVTNAPDAACFENRGTVYEFLGMESDAGLYYKLTVAKAGICVGKTSLPTAANTPKNKQQKLVHTAADFLLSKMLWPTSTSVQVRIAAVKKKRVTGAVARSGLRWRRRKHGSQALTSTKDDLSECVSGRKDPEGDQLLFAQVGKLVNPAFSHLGLPGRQRKTNGR